MIELLNANSLQIPLADKSVQCVITSPPYWALRDYGVDGQLGLEASPFVYIERMVEVFREVWRVLRDDGTLWLNIGDSYTNSTKQGGQSGAKNYTSGLGGYQTARNMKREFGATLKPKDLVGIPWRLAFALQADGWYLRSDIIWAKPNPMPESVTDRPTKAHEYIFLLTKNERYFYDAEAIKEPAQFWTGQAATFERDGGKATELVAPGQAHPSHRPNRESVKRGGFNGKTNTLPGREACWVIVPTRNRRSVWTVPTAPYAGAHFACFPPALVEPMIKAGSRPGDIVLDPFVGSGTTLQVARKLGRSGVGLDLSFTYLRDCARERLSLTALDEWENGAPSVGGLDDLPLFEGMNL